MAHEAPAGAHCEECLSTERPIAHLDNLGVDLCRTCIHALADLVGHPPRRLADWEARAADRVLGHWPLRDVSEGARKILRDFEGGPMTDSALRLARGLLTDYFGRVAPAAQWDLSVDLAQRRWHLTVADG